jgi:hypothetical protein
LSDGEEGQEESCEEDHEEESQQEEVTGGPEREADRSVTPAT